MSMSTMYLYGVAPTLFKDMPYEEALEFKLEKARTLYHTLTMRNGDEVRRHYVWKAMIHTQNLIEELSTWD